MRSTDGTPYLLFQLRHKNKDTFPNLLDISCAGHLLAGETVEDGVRELEEELGLTVPFEQLTYCGTVAQESPLPRGMDREFNHVFTYECGKPVSQYEVQLSEVAGLFRIPVSAFQELLSGAKESVSIEGILYEERTGSQTPATRNVTLQDFTPNTPEYYDLLFAAIQ